MNRSKIRWTQQLTVKSKIVYFYSIPLTEVLVLKLYIPVEESMPESSVLQLVLSEVEEVVARLAEESGLSLMVADLLLPPLPLS